MSENAAHTMSAMSAMSALPPYLAPAADALNKGDALAVVARGLGGTVHLAADVLRRALATREDARPILVLNAQHREGALREQLWRCGVDVDKVMARHRAAETSRLAAPPAARRDASRPTRCTTPPIRSTRPLGWAVRPLSLSSTRPPLTTRTRSACLLYTSDAADE